MCIGRQRAKLAFMSATENISLVDRACFAARAWRGLSPAGRVALLALECGPDVRLHHRTRACLIRRGFVDEQGVTAAGRVVLRYRPVRTFTSAWIGGRRVINVHLPEPTAAS